MHSNRLKKCNIKVIQADLGIFTLISEYSSTFRHDVLLGIIQAYSKPCNLHIKITLVYSETWYILNQN